MSTVKEKPASLEKVPDSVIEKMEALKKAGVEKNKDTGAMKAVEQVYYDTAPEGWTPALSKSVNKHDTEMAAALTLLAGEEGIPMLKKNKDLEKVYLEPYKLGEGTTIEGLEVHRKHSFTNHMSPEKEVIERVGYMPSFKLVSSASNSSAVIKRIKSHVADEAMKLLG